MPTTALRSALLTTFSALRRGPSPTDADLLAAFAASRDESAFAELVRRHGPLVRGASLRTVGDRGTAEDVFQATFLLLARKAGSVSWGPTVGPWLYQAVRRIGGKARAGAARHRHSPIRHDVAAPPTDLTAGLSHAEIQVALDEALARLPAHLRDPLVLCYLEGLTQDEAAVALGCSSATIKGRVTRGRERLRKLLGRRGLSLSAALSGLLVAESFVAAGAVAATARTAIAFVTTGAAPPKVLALVCGTSIGVKLVAGLFGIVFACAAVAAGLIAHEPAASARRVPNLAAHVAPPKPADHGEPLPVGAVARLGTRWLCGYQDPTWVGFSPDGKKVASKGMFGVIVCDAATGRTLVERTSYDAHNSLGWRADGTGVAVVRLSDESFFVSAFTDPDEKIPNPPAPPPGPNPKVGPDALESFALSPDGTRLAVVRNLAGERFTIDILHPTPGKLVSDLKRDKALGPFPGPCQEIRYAANGDLFYLSTQGKVIGERSLSLVDPVKNVISRSISIPAPGVSVWRYMFSLSADSRLVSFPPRGKHELNKHEDTLRVWDLKAGKELCSVPFAQSGGYGTGHAFTPDGKHLIASTDEAYFTVWEVATGKETARSPASEGAMYARNASSVAASPDGKRFATARRDGRVDIWHTATGKPAVSLDTHRDIVNAVAVSPDGRLGATHSIDGTVRVWELTTGKPGRVIPAPLGNEAVNWRTSSRQLTFAPDGLGLLFPVAGKLTMASPTTGKRLDLPVGLRDRKGSPGGFSADGKTLMTFAGNKVELWDWPAGTIRVTITVPLPDTVPAHRKKPTSVVVGSATLSPDGRFVFTNSIGYQGDPALGGGVQAANDVWDARTGKRLHPMMQPRVEYPPAAFSPDSKTMYLGGHSMDWPAEGRELADALTEWNPKTGKLILRFDYSKPPETSRSDRGFGRTVDPLAVSPDGRLLAAFSGHYTIDRSVEVYEVASGKVIKKLAGHSRTVTGLVFTPDSRRLVSVSEDQTGLVWDVTPTALGTVHNRPLGTNPAAAWELLGDLDPVIGYAAVATLVTAPTKALPLLRASLRPTSAPGDADVDRVIAGLDAEAFADRERATGDLERFGPNAVPRVKARLAKGVSGETKTRLSRFVERYTGSKYQLRCIRSVATLEAIGTAGARALLAELAKGPVEEVLTREAQGAIRRGEGRKAGP